MALSVGLVSLYVGTGLGMGRAAAAPLVTSGPSPQLTVTASGSTSIGLQVFANVNFTGATNPTGTLTFRLFGPTDATCVASPLFTSTVAVTGTSVNSDRYSTAAAGTYRWEATYSGDGNNGPAGPTGCGAAGATVIVSQASTSTAVTAAAMSGGTIRASAALMGYNPTGTVSFYLTAPGDTFCSNTPVFTSTVSVSGNGSYWSAPYTPVMGGQYKWRASYSGDANNQIGPITSCLDPDAAVTVSSPPAFATFSYPVDGQTGVDTSVPFTWHDAVSAQAYRVTVGTSQLASDLASSPVLPESQNSYLTPALPANRTLYAALYTELNGSWSSYQAISFTTAAVFATFSYPTNGQTGVDTSVPFRWQTVPQAQGYFMTIGTTVGGSDLAWTGVMPASQSTYAVAGLPVGTLSAALYTEVNGAWANYQAISFTGIATEAALTSPTSSQGNVNPNTTFSWTTVSGVQGYALWISTTYGGANLFNPGLLPATQSSITPPTLPAGQRLYAILFTLRNGVWVGQAITFTTGSSGGHAAAMKAAGSVNDADSADDSAAPQCPWGGTLPACTANPDSGT